MEKYVNRDGVTVEAELVTEGEHALLWHTVDVNGVEGHVTDEQFRRNWKPADEAPASQVVGTEPSAPVN